jgi:hypothetical protein
MPVKSLAASLLAISAVAVTSCSSQPSAAHHAAAVKSSRSAPAASASASASASRTNCPEQPILPPGPGAARDAVLTAQAAIPKVYTDIDIGGFRIMQAFAATRSTALGSIPYGMCNATVGARTWIVRILFPREKPSAVLSHGVLFLGRFSEGWRVWFVYQ